MENVPDGENTVLMVSVFPVDPDDQQRLAEILTEATKTVISEQRGYISTEVCKSLDGTSVLNYARWRSREGFERMLLDPDVQAYLREAKMLATADPQLYEMAEADQA